MTTLSPFNLAYSALNIGCAITSAYVAPKSFAFSFATGAMIGFGSGLKYQISLRLLDIKENVVQNALGNNQKSSKIQDLVEKILPVIQSIFSSLARFSTMGRLVSIGIGNTNEQRQYLIKKLDFIPGWKGTLLSCTTTAINLKYIALPLLSKISLCSGFTSGYAYGLYYSNPKKDSL